MFDAGLHPSAVVGHDMSVKLDRLAVGSILKQRNGLSDQCSIDANANSYRPSTVTYLVAWIRRGSRRRTDDGWALIMRAIKCRKGIWWMPWR